MKKQRLWVEAAKLAVYLLAVSGLVFFVIFYVGQRMLVEGSSMEPGISDGDHLIVDKLSYRMHSPARYDIVVFPYEPGVYFIKRVIGLPGERIRIDENGIIFVDGEPLAESYGREVIRDAGIFAEERELGEGEYFVLGDNRNESLDSRDGRVGPVREEAIVGRAWLRTYPVSRIGPVR